MDLDRVVGLAYWGAIQYWGESHGWPRKGWAYSFFDHTLQPFPQAYMVKSMFEEEPLVHIGVVDEDSQSIEWNDVQVGGITMSSHWNRTTGSTQNIFTYTNAEEVELFVNGKSVDLRKNDLSDPAKRNVIFWQDVPYQAGNIVAVAKAGGKEVARHRLETTGKAVALQVEIENPAWKADGMDLQYVHVYAVDSKGRRVFTADPNDVTFDLSGAAKLIAVDNGDHASDELFGGNTRRLHQGYALAVLRADRVGGDVEIKVSSKGLKSATAKMATISNR